MTALSKVINRKEYLEEAMSTTTPRLGFMGFGEVGYYMARGFKEAGIRSIYAYNNGSRHRPPYSEAFLARAEAVGVSLVSTPGELVENTDAILSTVVPLTAVAAAEEVAPFSPRLYADLNACSPETKRKCAEAIHIHGGRFVEGQIMGAPLALAHATPVIVAGELAGEFKALMDPYGMDISVVSTRIGDASMIKMVRDIITKGIMALSLEMLVAVRKAGLDLDKIPRTPSGFFDINAYAKQRWVPQTAIHARRRAGEMEEVIETLNGLGITPMMAEATRNRLAWCADFNLKDQFGGELPESTQAVLDAIEKLSQ